MSALKAVTFDLWDTLVDDDSDEPTRKARGLRTKAEERPYLVWETLNRHRIISIEEVNLAYRVTDAAFMKVWKGHSFTWTVEERLSVMLKGLGRTLPDEDFQGVANAIGQMEVDIPPDTIAGAKEALEDLAGRYKLSIVSDTIVTPGTGLRRMLEKHGLKQYFTGFAFSDEVGHSKPHRSMFDSAARQLGVELNEMVHVGDRDHNDVKGPQALGMKAVLFTASRDMDKDITSAQATCERYADLPAVIDGLAGREQ